MKKIAMIRSSPHQNGNTNLLADAFIAGAKQTRNEIIDVNLSKENIKYCQGCYGTSSSRSCTKTGICWQTDIMNILLESIRQCDVIVFATPVYFYSVSGQLKVFLDRTVPLYGQQYNFSGIYILSASESCSKSAMDGVIKDIEGWMTCFPGTKLAGVIYGTGILSPGAVKSQRKLLDDATQMGQSI